jgi:hypothetical protein
VSSAVRTSLQAALLLASLFVIFEPALRPTALRWAVLGLALAVFVDQTWRGLRSGELRKTFSQLLRKPPHTPALELLAVVCGVIAVVLVV